jgi:hypothetical protein
VGAILTFCPPLELLVEPTLATTLLEGSMTALPDLIAAFAFFAALFLEK